MHYQITHTTNYHMHLRSCHIWVYLELFKLSVYRSWLIAQTLLLKMNVLLQNQIMLIVGVSSVPQFAPGKCVTLQPHNTARCLFWSVVCLRRALCTCMVD